MTELIIGLGKNLGVDSSVNDIRSSDDCLSEDSRITVDAVGTLYQSLGTNAHILLFGGHTAGKDTLSEAAAMKQRLVHKFQIPSEVVMLEENSFDTRSNAIETRKWLAGVGMTYSKKKLVTLGFHAEAAKHLFEKNAVDIDEVIASEGILWQISASEALRILKWQYSPRVKKEERKERLRNLLFNTIDPNGYITHAAAIFSRKLIGGRSSFLFKRIQPRREALGSTIEP